MPAVVTIVGSSARAAAQSAARSGFRVHAADLFADQDLQQATVCIRAAAYPRDLGRAIEGSQTGPWMYTGALENHAEWLARWQELRPLAGNCAEVVRRVRNPRIVHDALRSAGLATPEACLDPAPLPRDGSWLAKPLHSAGVARIAPLDATWPTSSVNQHDFYFQQRLRGTPVAAVYLAATAGVRLLGVTEQLCGEAWGGASEFQYCGSIGPRPLSLRLESWCRQLGAALHQAFGLVGLFGVDAILQDDIIWPIEINPRYTASVEVLERATGLEAVAAHLAACESGLLIDPPPVHRQSGKLFVWARERCRFQNPGSLSPELFSTNALPVLADIPAPETPIELGCPIATVLADADRAEQVVHLLVERAAAVQAACVRS